MILILIPILISFVLGEPMLYMFPTNPELHPLSMYPNQQFMRGKVRDLPDSGVIYLNRIKPIGAELKMSPEKSIRKATPTFRAPSSFERYNSEEERSPVRFTTTTTVATPTKKSIKMSPEKEAVQKMKPARLTVPEEAELDMLLEDLMKNDNMKSSNLPRIGRSGKRHVGGVAPKIISFDGTARVENSKMPRVKAYGSPISVKLQPRKLFAEGTSTRNQGGADFDPWERMGQ